MCNWNENGSPSHRPPLAHCLLYGYVCAAFFYVFLCMLNVSERNCMYTKFVFFIEWLEQQWWKNCMFITFCLRNLKKASPLFQKLTHFLHPICSCLKVRNCSECYFFAPNLHPLHLNFDAFYSITKYGCIQSHHLRPKSDSIQRNQKKKKSIEKCENRFISIVVGVETWKYSHRLR